MQMNRPGPALLVRRAVFSCFYLGTMSACGGWIPATPTSALSSSAATQTPYAAPLSALTPTTPCTDNLLFLDDLTIPDYSVLPPGMALDKQWLVQNSGSCNWDSRYRLRLVSGDALGAPAEQALYPARAGMQATIRIFFTAPLEPGEYYSEWQAFDPNGLPFGESFAIRISVQY